MYMVRKPALRAYCQTNGLVLMVWMRSRRAPPSRRMALEYWLQLPADDARPKSAILSFTAGQVRRVGVARREIEIITADALVHEHHDVAGERARDGVDPDLAANGGLPGSRLGREHHGHGER